MTSHAKARLGTRQLKSGDWRDTCPDCGTTTVAPTLEAVDAAVCACPPAPHRVRYVVELNCGHCARTIGGVVLAEPRAPVLIPRNLRCRWCNGPPQPGDIISQTVYTPLPKMAAPHRGRPPHWLAEQRRLERERAS